MVEGEKKRLSLMKTIGIELAEMPIPEEGKECKIKLLSGGIFKIDKVLGYHYP